MEELAELKHPSDEDVAYLLRQIGSAEEVASESEGAPKATLTWRVVGAMGAVCVSLAALGISLNITAGAVSHSPIGLIRVPNVTGMTIPQAVVTLQRAGLSDELLVNGQQHGSVRNEILSQDPRPSAYAAPDTVIRISPDARLGPNEGLHH